MDWMLRCVARVPEHSGGTARRHAQRGSMAPHGAIGSKALPQRLDALQGDRLVRGRLDMLRGSLPVVSALIVLSHRVHAAAVAAVSPDARATAVSS